MNTQVSSPKVSIQIKQNVFHHETIFSFPILKKINGYHFWAYSVWIDEKNYNWMN